MKLKARSRLKPNSPFTGQGFKLEKFSTIFIFLTKVSLFQSVWWQKWWTARKNKLVQLVIGLTAYFLTFYLIINYYPHQLASFFWPNSYLGLIGIVGVGHLYLGSFLTLKPRLAFFLSLALSWLLWLKLHQFEINFELVAISVLVGLAFEIGLRQFLSKR